MKHPQQKQKIHCLHAKFSASKGWPKIWARVSLKTPKNNPHITLINQLFNSGNTKSVQKI